MNTFGKPLSHLFDKPTDILSPINLFINVTLAFNKLALLTDNVGYESKNIEVGLIAYIYLSNFQENAQD